MDPLEARIDDASAALAIGDLESAESHYKAATELAPGSFDAWHALAMVRMKLGRFPEAVEAALRCTELHPSDAIAWTTLSMCHQRNGQIPEAEAAAAKSRVLSWGEQLKNKPSSVSGA